MSTRHLNLVTLSLLCGPLAMQIAFFSLPLNKAVNSWQITEWLISYDAGFIRRGLAGEIIGSISTLVWVPPSILAVFSSLVAYGGLIYFIIKKTKLNLPIYLLFSPLFLGLPIYSNFLIRKDVFLILALAIALLVIKKRSKNYSAFCANLIACIAIVNHEAFAFLGLPLIILSYSINFSKKLLSIELLLTFIPSILVSLLCFISKGDASMASVITESWNSLFFSKYKSYCCLNENSAAINALGWTTIKGINLSLSVLGDVLYGFLWVPLIWFITFLLSISFIGELFFKDKSQRNNFYQIIIIQTMMVGPLFLLGWDFGRWIFFINSSAIIWTSLYHDPFEIINPSVFSYKVLTRIDRLPRASLFFFAIPACCWSIESYSKSTPIGAFINSIRYAIEFMGTLSLPIFS